MKENDMKNRRNKRVKTKVHDMTLFNLNVRSSGGTEEEKPFFFLLRREQGNYMMFYKKNHSIES